MADLNAITIRIFHLIHGQPLQTHYFRRIPPLLVRLRQYQHIPNQHPKNRPNPPLNTNLPTKRPLNLAEKIRLGIAVAPDIEMKAGIVALKKFLMALYPFTELSEGEAGLEGSTCQF